MSARPAIRWEGAAPPTPVQLRAIGRAWRSGQIRAGDRVSCAARNPSPATEAYREFHWGRPARKRRRVNVPQSPEVFELGKLIEIVYSAKKGRQSALWHHKFGWPYPILTGTPEGRLGPIVGGGARVTKRGIVG